MSKALLYTILIFLVTQSAVWFQTNGQFISEWCKNNPFILSLFGIPISLGYIYATKWAFIAFDDLLWPGRLLGFALGMISFAVFTNWLMGEGISLKVMVSLLLALILVLIQVFWK
tara:strand:+ start:1509 stop:1853 length:345 start_codon:yes stop_codon:yes gene_type:complete